MLASRHGPELFYVGCDVGGFYRSEDGGRSYSIYNSGLSNYWVECIAEHPADPSVLYLGSRGGAFKSTDGGRHWKELRNGFPPVSEYGYAAEISRIAIAPDRPDTVFAAVGQPRALDKGQSALYRSDDAGASWRQIIPKGALPDGLNLLDLCPDPRSADRLLVSTQRGLFRSEDGGKTWAPSNDGLPAHLRTRRLARCPAAPDTVYVSLRAKGGETPWQAGVYRSTDGGRSWQPRNNGLRQAPGNPGADDMLCSWVDCLAVHPRDPDTVYAGGASWWDSGVYKTADGGATWAKVLSNAKQGWLTFWGPAATCLTLSPCRPDTVAFGTSGCIYRTDDGGKTWSQRYTAERADGKISGTGLEVTCLHSVTPDPHAKGRLYFGYFDIGLLITDDNGRTFRRCMKGIPDKYANSCFTVAFSPADPRRLWGGFGQWGQNAGTVAESRDGGETWTLLEGEGRGGVSAIPVGIAVFPQDNAPDPELVYLAKNKGILASANDGKDWAVRQRDLDGQAIGAFTQNGAALLAASVPSDDGRPAAVYASADRGRSWQRLTPDTAPIGEVRRIAASANRIVVTARDRWAGKNGKSRLFPGGVWTSADSGKTWQKVREAPFCEAAAVRPGDPDTFAVSLHDHPYHDHSTGGGVLLTRDGGKTWASLNGDTLTCLGVSWLAYDGATLWAGTAGNSAFRLLHE
jgi:photosystem II stability/assembly factor-like uncharacterized protein